MKKKIFALASIACALTMVMATACTNNNPDNSGNSGNSGNTGDTDQNKPDDSQKPDDGNKPDGPEIPEQIKGTVIWVLGDSTGCDFSNDSTDKVKYYPRVGFGVHLGDYFNSEITVRNIAWSGRSSKNYVTDEQSKVPYAEYTTNVKEGDYVIIAFGHNDEKPENTDRFSDPTQSTSTEGSFKYNLYNYYVKIAEDKGATPILCTPIVRYDSKGEYADGTNTVHVASSGDYAAAVRELATEKNVTLIDNTKLTQETWKAAGADSSSFHALDKPEGGVLDGTHLNVYGAKTVAYLMANAIKNSDNSLKNYVKPDITAPTKENDLKPNPDYVEVGYTTPTEWNSLLESADETAGWHASMFGDLGTSPNTTNFSITGASTFDVTMTVTGDKGKIQNASDGYIMYFKQVEASKDFILSAKMTILATSGAKQVAYGLVVRDDMYIDLRQAINSDYVAAGGFLNDAKESAASWKRDGGSLTRNTACTTETAVNTEMLLKIEKTGNEYKMYVDNELVETYTVDLTKVDKDYVYAGLMACRNCKVIYENISLEIK